MNKLFPIVLALMCISFSSYELERIDSIFFELAIEYEMQSIDESIYKAGDFSYKKFDLHLKCSYENFIYLVHKFESDDIVFIIDGIEINNNNFRKYSDEKNIDISILAFDIDFSNISYKEAGQITSFNSLNQKQVQSDGLIVYWTPKLVSLSEIILNDLAITKMRLSKGKNFKMEFYARFDDEDFENDKIIYSTGMDILEALKNSDFMEQFENLVLARSEFVIKKDTKLVEYTIEGRLNEGILQRKNKRNLIESMLLLSRLKEKEKFNHQLSIDNDPFDLTNVVIIDGQYGYNQGRKARAIQPSFYIQNKDGLSMGSVMYNGYNYTVSIGDTIGDYKIIEMNETYFLAKNIKKQNVVDTLLFKK